MSSNLLHFFWFHCLLNYDIGKSRLSWWWANGWLAAGVLYVGLVLGCKATDRVSARVQRKTFELKWSTSLQSPLLHTSESAIYFKPIRTQLSLSRLIYPFITCFHNPSTFHNEPKGWSTSDRVQIFVIRNIPQKSFTTLSQAPTTSISHTILLF